MKVKPEITRLRFDSDCAVRNFSQGVNKFCNKSSPVVALRRTSVLRVRAHCPQPGFSPSHERRSAADSQIARV